ncbi:MAG: hypothetical protein V4707_05225 [Pseudomonadota bacterium]
MSEEDASFNYRARARRRLDSARAHLASGEDHQLLYACLEVRLAIESLTYDLVRLYRDDLAPEVLRTWEPHKLFAELLETDPDADAGLTISFAGADGSFDGPDVVEFKEHRLNAKWASKTHRALGYFLHERLLIELETGKDSDPETLRRKIDESVAEIDLVLKSSGFNLRFRQAPKFACECGETVSRSIARLQSEVAVTCKACGKEFLVRRKGHDEFDVLEKTPPVELKTDFPTSSWVGPSFPKGKPE